MVEGLNTFQQEEHEAVVKRKGVQKSRNYPLH